MGMAKLLNARSERFSRWDLGGVRSYRSGVLGFQYSLPGLCKEIKCYLQGSSTMTNLSTDSSTSGLSPNIGASTSRIGVLGAYFTITIIMNPRNTIGNYIRPQKAAPRAVKLESEHRLLQNSEEILVDKIPYPYSNLNPNLGFRV